MNNKEIIKLLLGCNTEDMMERYMYMKRQR